MGMDFRISLHDKEGYIFVAATPRAGTRYIAHVCQAVGVDVKHERFGERGISAFHIVPHLASRKHGTIIHQVRDPIKTISSMQLIDYSWPYIYYYTGIDQKRDGQLHAIMKLWIFLNKHIEKHSDIRYRVENIDERWPELCDLLNVSEPTVPDVPRDTHSRVDVFRQLSWHELEFRDSELTKRTKDMTVKYGYEVE